jgi:trehalose 6-phosphate phosphatase
MDGTLLDLAPRPDEVRLAPGLLDHLTALHGALGGALAVVTGRRLDDVDRILAPLRLPAAAEHGSVLRASADAIPRSAATPALPDGWRERAAQFVDARAGMLLEPKSAGFVLHYRLAPEQGAAARSFMDGLAAEDPRFEVLRADMAWELRPCGIHKGLGVRALMAEAAFAGRKPIFIGDDVTDEDGIAAARDLGGQGFMVPDTFGTPAGVRAWLADICRHIHAPTA